MNILNSFFTWKVALRYIEEIGKGILRKLEIYLLGLL
jgi:hypothetical protein